MGNTYKLGHLADLMSINGESIGINNLAGEESRIVVSDEDGLLSASIIDNSVNWNTTFGWGNHSGLYAAFNHGDHGLSTHAGLTTTAHGLGTSAFHPDDFFALASHGDHGLATHVALTTTAHGLGASAFHADNYFALSGHDHSGVYAPASTISFPGFGSTHVLAAYGDHTHGVFERGDAGFVPSAPAGTGTTKFLREDGQWEIPAEDGMVRFWGTSNWGYMYQTDFEVMSQSGYKIKRDSIVTQSSSYGITSGAVYNALLDKSDTTHTIQSHGETNIPTLTAPMANNVLTWQGTQWGIAKPWTGEGYVTGTPWTGMGYVTGTPWTSANTSGSAGSVTNSLTFATSGGDAAGTTFNGSSARTISYVSVGAAALSGLSTQAFSTAALTVGSNGIGPVITVWGTSAGAYSVIKTTSNLHLMAPTAGGTYINFDSGTGGVFFGNGGGSAPASITSAGVCTVTGLTSSGGVTIGSSGVGPLLTIWGTTAGANSVIKTTSNLHIDAPSSGATYINHYSGSGGVYFGASGGVSNASISGPGVFTGKGVVITGTISATSTITGSEVYRGSSRTLKHNIIEYNGSALDIINSTKIHTYNLNVDNSFGVGFIAEDTHKWLSGENQKNHSFGNHLGIITKAIQEEDNKITKLERKVTELKNQIKLLQDARG